MPSPRLAQSNVTTDERSDEAQRDNGPRWHEGEHCMIPQNAGRKPTKTIRQRSCALH
jgi:hypothetical protein